MDTLSETIQAFATKPSFKQKTIGIIGGTSWESTLLYYQWLNQGVRQRLGGLNSAKLLLYSVNYQPIVHLEQQGRWEEVGRQLAEAAKTLQEAGADFILLCCNTLHKVTPAIEAAITIPFLHIADPAGRLLREARIKKIGLLGTQFTMEDGFYASRLQQKFGLDVVTPSLEDRIRMDAIIYKELCQGKILPASKAQALRIIQELEKNGAEAILLGCTELGLLIESGDAALPVYDTTLLHVKEALELSIH